MHTFYIETALGKKSVARDYSYDRVAYDFLMHLEDTAIAYPTFTVTVKKSLFRRDKRVIHTKEFLTRLTRLVEEDKIAEGWFESGFITGTPYQAKYFAT